MILPFVANPGKHKIYFIMNIIYKSKKISQSGKTIIKTKLPDLFDLLWSEWRYSVTVFMFYDLRIHESRLHNQGTSVYEIVPSQHDQASSVYKRIFIVVCTVIKYQIGAYDNNKFYSIYCL